MDEGGEERTGGEGRQGHSSGSESNLAEVARRVDLDTVMAAQGSWSPWGWRLPLPSWETRWLLVKAHDGGPPQKLPLETGCCLAPGQASGDGSPHPGAGHCRGCQGLTPGLDPITSGNAACILTHCRIQPQAPQGRFLGSSQSPLPAVCGGPGQNLTPQPP